MKSGNFKTGELAFELGGSQNQQILFKPTATVLRGRWTTDNETGTSGIGFSAMPDIPGMVVCISPKDKTFRILDPLGFKENATTLTRANEVKEPYFGKSRPHEPVERANLSDSDVKSILWHLIGLVDAETALRVHGKVPTHKSVLEMKGKLRLRYLDSSQATSKFATDEELELLNERYGEAGVPVATSSFPGTEV